MENSHSSKLKQQGNLPLVNDGFFEPSMRALKRLREGNIKNNYCEKNQLLDIKSFSLCHVKDGIYVNDLLAENELEDWHFLNEGNALKQAELLGEMLFGILKSAHGYLKDMPSVIEIVISKNTNKNIDVNFTFSVKN